VISTPESKYYRTQKGFPRAFKVGSSWDLGKRINSYLLSFPFDAPEGLEIEAGLLMNHANTKKEKDSIMECERYIHKKLHTKYTAAKYFPGFGNGQRLNKDRVEWYSGVPLRVIFAVIRESQKEFGGVFCEGDDNFAHKWRAYSDNKPFVLKLFSKKK